MQRPDYKIARKNAGFRWSVSGSQDALRQLAGIPIKEFNLNPKACIETYRRGRPLFKEMFGPDVAIPGLSTPAVSYGHINALGAELVFPEGGEVSFQPLYQSLDDGIKALGKKADFAVSGKTPFYLEFQKEMQKAFPEEPVRLGIEQEGPVTTAWALRGEAWFMDIYDNPEKCKQFLRLATASTVEYFKFKFLLNHPGFVKPKSSALADDIAAMMPPELWPEIVLPFWEQWFTNTTAGARYAHCEDLRTKQLPFLEQAGLSEYDPSISPKLTPKIIAANCRVPFGWRLASFVYAQMSVQDVKDFVFQSAAEGASSVHTIIEAIMCNPATVEKVGAFIEAGKKVKEALDKGADRAEIAKWIQKRQWN